MSSAGSDHHSARHSPIRGQEPAFTEQGGGWSSHTKNRKLMQLLQKDRPTRPQWMIVSPKLIEQKKHNKVKKQGDHYQLKDGENFPEKNRQ